MSKTYNKGIFFAILAAALYAINAPFSKILLEYIPPTLMAGFLYLGAGLGMVIVSGFRKINHISVSESKLSKDHLPSIIAMIILDIAAPIFLMVGLMTTSAANTSLLNNFEIVTTAVIALCFFKEKISLRLWFGIIFVTVSCLTLSIENISSFSFSTGSVFVIVACICWGIENNCTRKLSANDPLEIVLLKGIFSGGASVIIGFVAGERLQNVWSVIATLCIGLIAYGMSIFFYVYAQRSLGAARTSAYYAIAPFIGTVLSLVIFPKIPPYTYFIALIFMIIGAVLCSKDN